MFTAVPGDVILRASIDGSFHVLDATTFARVTGPLPLAAALAYACDLGAPHIFQQAVDRRGRLMGDPARFGVQSERAIAGQLVGKGTYDASPQRR